MSDATPSGDWSRSAAARRQYDLIGGLVLAAAGLALLATSFLLHNPVPLTVRGAIVIFTAVGHRDVRRFVAGAESARRLRRHGADPAGADRLRGFERFAGHARLRVRSRHRAASVRLHAGALVAWGRGRRPADGGAAYHPVYKIRGMVFIIGSILAFAATIRPLGLVIASFTTMVICAAAAEDVKWRETVIVGDRASPPSARSCFPTA